LGFRLKVCGIGLKVYNLNFGLEGLRFKVEDLGLKGLRFKV
jgi:hypothetical protein